MRLNIRLAYHKTGRARFLSHLDTMRVFVQAFIRAGLPLRYTEGFNPHPVLSVALPLGVGVESVAERLDFSVTENISCGSLPARLNTVLPEGFHVTQAVAGGRPAAQIAFARYEVKAESSAEPEGVVRLFTTSAVVEKRNKKKQYIPTDIVPFIREIVPINLSGRDNLPPEQAAPGMGYSITLSANNPVLNPEYIAEAWRSYLDPDASFSFKRAALLDASGESFDNLI